MKKSIIHKYCLVGFASLVFSSTIVAQQSAEELAKKLANPIAALISVPMQHNSDHGIGQLRGSRYVLNVQPVIPMRINNKLNLITRWIVPIISQHNITGVSATESGVGDAVISGFLSPVKEGSTITWGAGPVILVPIGSNKLSAQQFGIGPSFVALAQNNGFTYGGLINQIWGTSSIKNTVAVSQMLVNPFITYNWKSGAGITAAFEWTQNWTANQTTIFFIPMLSGITALGKQKVSFGIGPRLNVAAPDDQKSRLGLRASLAFLFPK